MTWFEAEENCMQSNAHLVSIHDVDEAEFIQYMMTSNWTQSSSKTYIGKLLKHLPKKKCKMIIINVLNVIIIIIIIIIANIIIIIIIVVVVLIILSFALIKQTALLGSARLFSFNNHET